MPLKTLIKTISAFSSHNGWRIPWLIRKTFKNHLVPRASSSSRSARPLQRTTRSLPQLEAERHALAATLSRPSLWNDYKLVNHNGEPYGSRSMNHARFEASESFVKMPWHKLAPRRASIHSAFSESSRSCPTRPQGRTAFPMTSCGSFLLKQLLNWLTCSIKWRRKPCCPLSCVW